MGDDEEDEDDFLAAEVGAAREADALLLATDLPLDEGGELLLAVACTVVDPGEAWDVLMLTVGGKALWVDCSFVESDDEATALEPVSQATQDENNASLEAARIALGADEDAEDNTGLVLAAAGVTCDEVVLFRATRVRVFGERTVPLN